MQLIDSFEAGHRVEAMVSAYRRWSVDLHTRGDAVLEDDPFYGHREISTRSTFEQVCALPEGAPAKRELRDWVAALTIERVTHEDRVELERAMRTECHTIAPLGDRAWSLRALSLEAVLTGIDARRDRILSDLVDIAGDASSRATWWLARRHAAAGQLGLASLQAVEAPLAAELSIEQVVETVLRSTDGQAGDALAGCSSWAEVLMRGSAPDALEGWPARLSAQWLWSLFGRGPLAEGLNVNVPPLGTPTCGASFLRAFDVFGTALHRGAVALDGLPFFLRERPYDAACASYGTLFASLLASVPFLRRRLGLGTATAREQARMMALAMLVHTRVAAIKAAVASCPDQERASHAHTSVGVRALLTTLPEELTGVVPRYDPRAVSKLTGIMVGAALREQLEERFDEDWFDNPRALSFIREIDGSTRVELDADALMRGAKAAARFFEAPFD
jgi:hypothetical protein